MKLEKIIKNDKEIFRCSCCEKEYEQLPFCFGTDFPDYYYSVPIEERNERIEIEQSLCVVDKEHFFHRGRLEIPVHNSKENLFFDVWLSISKDNFETRMNDWENPDRVKNEPYFGWLQTQIPTYEHSINIEAIALEEELGYIPKIKIQDDDHKLTIDQKNGISYEKAIGIIEYILDDNH